MVFQFDQPDAAPPQSVLLAVPPDLAATSWTLWTLQQVLLETLDLARLRLVDPEALDRRVGHFLPRACTSPSTPPATPLSDRLRVAGTRTSGEEGRAVASITSWLRLEPRAAMPT